MKKGYIALISAAAVLVMGGTAVYGLKSRDTSEAKYDQQQKKQNAQKESEEERKKLPVLTIGDTDDERRYGYEVLYKHDGITILADSCAKKGKSAYLTLTFRNDTDKEANISTEYIAPNSYISSSDLSVTVPANAQKTETVTDINDLINDETIKDIRMKFNICGDYEDGEVIQSKQIHTYFDIKGTEPSHSSRDEYLFGDVNSGITFYFDEAEDIINDDGELEGTVFKCYVENNSDIDQNVSLGSHTCYSQGKEVSAENRLFNLVPAHTGHYILIKFFPYGYDGEIPSIDKIDIQLHTSDNETFETMLDSEVITIEKK